MSHTDWHPTRREAAAFGLGLAVTLAAAGLVSPFPFPLNFLIAFGLGGMTFYAARKVFDPRTAAEVEEQQAAREFAAILEHLQAIAARTAEAGRKPYIPPDIAEDLGGIAAKIERIIRRFREQPRDFTGAASTLLVLQKFDEILAHYLKVIGSQLFLDQAQAEKVIADTEDHVIPMIERALDNLGRKLDSGETSDKDVHGDTLADMLSGLDLIGSRPSDRLIAARKEAPNDTQE